MREVKFRAYVKHIEIMVRVIEIDFYLESIAAWITSPDEGDPSVYSFDEVVIEQFTGLHDKNGKEIYKGDILENVTYSQVGTFKIEWATPDDYCGFVAVKPDKFRELFLAKNFENCVVVGNIHETPELMEKGK